RLVVAKHQARHRYFALAGPQVAEALEALAAISPPAPVRSLRESIELGQLRAARTCYDHLAGRLGVGLAQGLLDRGWLSEDGGGWNIGEAGADDSRGSASMSRYSADAAGRLSASALTGPSGARTSPVRSARRSRSALMRWHGPSGVWANAEP